MAISFRANAFGANGALTCNKPSGTLSGDFLIAGVSIFDNTTTVTPPSGWSLVRADFDGVGTRNLIYTLTAGGSEPSSYTWTTSPAAQFTEILIACFTGFTGTPTVDAQGAAGTSTTSCPSVTPTGSADMLWCYFGDNSGISSAYTAPSGMTVETGTADFGNSAAHLLLSSNAATGTKQFSPTTGIGEGTTIALSDVVSGGGGAVVSAAVHGQWPNPLRSTSRVALTRKGATENTDVCAAAEQFYGDGTQLLLANPHGRWPNPLRSTQRMALTTKVRGYNPNTSALGANDNDLTRGNVDQFYGVQGQPGTQLSDAIIAIQSNSALSVTAAQVVEPVAPLVSNSVLSQTSAQIVEPVVTLQANAALVQTSAQVVDPAAPMQSNSALVETSAQIRALATLQSNSVLAETSAQVVNPVAPVQSNSALSVPNAQLVEPTAPLQANAVLSVPNVQVVDPSAPLVSNSVLIASGSVGGQVNGTCTMVSNSVLAVASAQVVVSLAILQANSVLSATGSVTGLANPTPHGLTTTVRAGLVATTGDRTGELVSATTARPGALTATTAARATLSGNGTVDRAGELTATTTPE